MFFARRLFALAGLSGVLVLAGFSGGDANAQQIYRIVAPDGRITFSDTAPRDANTRATVATAVPMPGASVDNSALPFELREAANRYPVTLYTGASCAPCGSGRAFLSGRGIPFTEKTVTTNDDIDALKRLAGAPSLPFLTIGGQQLKGYSESEWGQFLDAAGYPKTSQLPASYSAQPATPLVAVQPPQTPAAATRDAPRGTSPAAAPAQNPAGITF
jgi:glutaredoxin